MTRTICARPTPGGSPLSDADYMHRIAGGDLHGIAPLYGRHHRQTRGAAATLAGAHLARDLCDEAFGRLLLVLMAGQVPEVGARYFLYGALRESHRVRSPSMWRPDERTVPELPRDWRARLRRAAADHVLAESEGGSAPLTLVDEWELLRSLARADRSAAFVCRATDILLQISGVADPDRQRRSRRVHDTERRPAELRWPLSRRGARPVR